MQPYRPVSRIPLETYSMLTIRQLSLTALAILIVTTSLRAIEVPPLTEVEPRIEQGLALTVESDGSTDLRRDRHPALYVPSGDAVTPFVKPGPFKATWTGYLNIDLRGRFYFHVSAIGKVKLTIGEKVLLEADSTDLQVHKSSRARLSKGANPIVIEYESPATGDATFRLEWSSSDIAQEPVPSSVFTHDAHDESLRSATRLRAGRKLVANRHCLKCHVSTDESLLSKGMPELGMDVPSLLTAGQRLNTVWMAHWITNPKSLRHSATMPRLFKSKDDAPIDERAWHVAAYLQTLGAATTAKPFIAQADDLKAGGELFAQFNCIACHKLPAHSDTATDSNRISLKGIADKYKPAGLRDFLMNPQQHYSWNPMPNFQLTERQATQLAFFLFSKATPELQPIASLPQPDARKGRELVDQAGCISCHALPSGNRPAVPGIADLLKSSFDSGCMAESSSPDDAAPDFAFSEDERAALTAFAATDWKSLHQVSMSEFATRQLQDARCVHCHRFDAKQTLLDATKAEVTAFAKPVAINEGEDEGKGHHQQVIPPLTNTGDQLQPTWMADRISGRMSYEPRPWLHARMPAFPVRAQGIAKGLSLQHGWKPVDPQSLTIDDEKVGVGEKLASVQNGFSCVNCHAVGDKPAIAVFEGEGINLSYVADRLRPAYFYRWMMDPKRIDPATIMPKFADAEGYTQLFEVYGGDGRKQFEALWHYIHKVKVQPQSSNDVDTAELVKIGETVYKQICFACHAPNLPQQVAPPLEGLLGKERKFRDGTTATADEAYIIQSIIEPQAKVVDGFSPVMPALKALLTEQQINGVVEYVKSLSK